MKSINDELYEINLSSVKMNKMQLKDEVLDGQCVNVMSIDAVSNELFLAKKGHLTIFTKQNN